jgi:hypothetical protein
VRGHASHTAAAVRSSAYPLTRTRLSARNPARPGVQFVERREHRLVGHGSDQANKVLAVRSGGKKPLRGGQLIE